MTSPFEPERLEEIRRELEGEIATLERRMRAGDDALRPVSLDPGSVGRLSRMDELQNQAMAQGARERETQRLDALHGALERIERGSYGTCQSCGRPIGLDRLDAYPEISTCRACTR